MTPRSFELSDSYKSLIKPIANSNELASLQHDIIITKPWNKSRLSDALASTGNCKTIDNWTQDTNHKIDLYLPFRIAIVSGGNHSIARGMLDSNEKLKPNNVYDFSELLKFVSCDGDNYYETHTRKIIQEVQNPKFAAIWEIARRMSNVPKL